MELNAKISNAIFSNMQAMSDKTYVDYERIYKYCLDDLADLEVSLKNVLKLLLVKQLF